MNLAVAYVAVTNGPQTSDLIARFVATWRAYPPGHDCDVFVACNGGPLAFDQGLMLHALNAKFVARANDPGWDVTAFIDLAAGPCKDYDFVLFCGESIYFTRPGWLKRLADAAHKWGKGFYGIFGSFNVRAHLQTSAFFCPPSMLKMYPGRPSNRAQRMAFEHGVNALWRRVDRMRFPVKLVTWDGEYDPRMWRQPKNTLWRGDQSNVLFFNNHAAAFENANDETKKLWSRKADSPYQ